MPVTPAQIQRIAALAHLRLVSSDITQLSSELSAVLDYIVQLQRVSAAYPDQRRNEVPGKTAVRGDIVQPSLTSHEALMNAPQSMEDYFIVPRVIG